VWKRGRGIVKSIVSPGGASDQEKWVPRIVMTQMPKEVHKKG